MLNLLAEATVLERSPDGVHVAVGCAAAADSSSEPLSVSNPLLSYNDGTIRVWNVRDKVCDVTLNGHRVRSAFFSRPSLLTEPRAQSGVSALRFHEGGNLLASGSRDTEIIVWDILQEQGLYRLKVRPQCAHVVVTMVTDST